MNKLIIVLSVVLALLLALAAFLYFSDKPDPSPSLPPETTSQAPVTESAAETEPPTTAATEARPELQVNEENIVLNGVAMETFLFEKKVYVGAAEFASAAGMTLEGEDPVKMTGRDTVEYTQTGMNVTCLGQAHTLPGDTLTVDGKAYVEFPALVEALAYPAYVDEEKAVTYYTPGARPFEIPEGVDVPVLMYHAVSDDIWGIDELFVSPEDMDEQLAYLVENGYDPIWFEDLAHLEDYDKPVILTFDDGYDDNYTELFPLLQKHKVKATVFVIGNAPGTLHKMTEEQIREMSDSGLVSIQSHGYTHDDMDMMNEEETEYELSQSKLAIARITGKAPYVLCYPTGKYNDNTLEIGPKYYLFGLKMVGGQYNTSDDPFLVSRYYMSRYDSLDDLAWNIESAGETNE